MSVRDISAFQLKLYVTTEKKYLYLISDMSILEMLIFALNG